MPPEEFTAARTRHEKEAKATGDRSAAAEIHALAKPTVTAWLANQLVRSHRSSLEPVLELGAALRDATQNLDGDQLRELSRQQQKVMYALVQQARALARAAGRSVSEDAVRGLEETLRAALADERAASLLLAGRLTDGLHSSDFGSGFGSASDDLADVIPISRKLSGVSPSQPERPPRDEQRQLAEHDLVEAGRALAEATSARDDVQARATEADAAAVAAHSRVEELRQEVSREHGGGRCRPPPARGRQRTGASRAPRPRCRTSTGRGPERRDRLAKED